jgi:hypothetical protein
MNSSKISEEILQAFCDELRKTTTTNRNNRLRSVIVRNTIQHEHTMSREESQGDAKQGGGMIGPCNGDYAKVTTAITQNLDRR